MDGCVTLESIRVNGISDDFTQLIEQDMNDTIEFENIKSMYRNGAELSDILDNHLNTHIIFYSLICCKFVVEKKLKMLFKKECDKELIKYIQDMIIHFKKLQKLNKYFKNIYKEGEMLSQTKTLTYYHYISGLRIEALNCERYLQYQLTVKKDAKFSYTFEENLKILTNTLEKVKKI